MSSKIFFDNEVSNLVTQQGLTRSAAIDRLATAKPALVTLVNALGATPERLALFNTGLTRRLAAPARQEARAQFIAEVHKYMETYRVDYEKGWAACQRKHAQLFNEMERGGAAQFSNEVAGPGPCATMRISPEAVGKADVFDVAFRANGQKLSPLDPGKVFDALVSYYAKKNGWSQDTALEECKTLFANLWGEVQAVAKM